MTAGLLVNISGPYAVGKDAVIDKLMQRYDPFVHRVRTLTTRQISAEKDPFYSFAPREEFFRIVGSGDWIYNHQLSGETVYGTDLMEIRKYLSAGCLCLHSIHPNDDGAGRLRFEFGSDLLSIAVLPPGSNSEEQLGILRQRLMSRRRDSPESLRLRIGHQVEALDFIARNAALECRDGVIRDVFDSVVVNAVLDETVERVAALLEERWRGNG